MPRLKGWAMKTLKEMEALLMDYGLSGYDEQIKEAVRSSVHIIPEPAGDERIPIGASKMGGLPDLPKGVDWFRQELTDIPLSFICQINFAEVKPYDAEDRLPVNGILYVFYDCSMYGMPWGFDPRDSDGKVVYYYDGDLSQLERKEAPEDMEENGCVFGAAALHFETAFDLPDLDSPAGEAIAFAGDDQEKYWELMDDVREFLSNKLLGHSDNIQGGMELSCELRPGQERRALAAPASGGQQRGYRHDVGRLRQALPLDHHRGSVCEELREYLAYPAVRVKKKRMVYEI